MNRRSRDGLTRTLAIRHAICASQ